ncbi:MAG: hypothetical protein AB8B96_21210 [Lysobacterales bacterium]
MDLDKLKLAVCILFPQDSGLISNLGVQFSFSEFFVMAILPTLVAAALIIYARYALAKYGAR